jgi:flagellar biosynthesis protein FliQ
MKTVVFEFHANCGYQNVKNSCRIPSRKFHFVTQLKFLVRTFFISITGEVPVSSDLALQLMGDLLWNALLIASPLLLVTLAIGVLISVVQVVTQVQEMSLTYIPKIIAAVIVLVVFGPWMLKRLMTFSIDLIGNIPNYF